jgi:hypothetical protein
MSSISFSTDNRKRSVNNELEKYILLPIPTVNPKIGATIVIISGMVDIYFQSGRIFSVFG